MSPPELSGIAVSLGIDCLAVSACLGSSCPARPLVALTAFMFGLFQFGMSLGGMAGGGSLGRILDSAARIAGPLLLAGIGVLMIVKGLRSAKPSLRLVGILAVFGAAVGTSIDALGAGIALGLVGGISVGDALVIGAVSSAMSTIGFAGGRALARYTDVAEDVSGVVLIILAGLMLVYSG